MSSLHSYLTISLTAIVLLFSGCLESTSDPDVDDGDGYSHMQQPGTAANDLLSDENFTRLVVEIDYMPSYAPNEEALDSLQAFLQQRLNKTSVTILEPTSIESGDQSQYSASDIRALEERYRDEFTEGNTLSVYMIIVNGFYAQNNVLGIAYYNTSNAFFGPAYTDASSGFGSPSPYQVQSTSFRHEFGHLFGLVNIEGSGTDMQTDHQDEENGHHCDNDSCLMYYAMERPDLIAQFFDNSVAQLDANCLADLQANGGK